ncbi:hypothetical protein IIA95_02780 [Patescibacteria group bacterium]|nr:hypothetical protein [Patescibacteria group bacterium]
MPGRIDYAELEKQSYGSRGESSLAMIAYALACVWRLHAGDRFPDVEDISKLVLQQNVSKDKYAVPPDEVLRLFHKESRIGEAVLEEAMNIRWQIINSGLGQRIDNGQILLTFDLISASFFLRRIRRKHPKIVKWAEALVRIEFS